MLQYFFIHSFYLSVKEFVICFNTHLFIYLFFNYEHGINRMGVANTECYIKSDINSFYLCEKDCNVQCFNTPLLFFS